MSLTLSRSTRFPDLEGIETRRHIFDAFLNIDGSTRFPDLEGIETALPVPIDCPGNGSTRFPDLEGIETLNPCL